MEYLRQGLQLLQSSPFLRIKNISPVYETKAVGYTDQPDFLNLVVHVETSLSPRDLLKLCMQIEKDNQRTREIRWGPRTLDMDILLYGSQVIREDTLEIPHPRMDERAFVMVPLRDLAPALVHPVYNQTIQAMTERVPGKEGVVQCTTIHWHDEFAPTENSKG